MIFLPREVSARAKTPPGPRRTWRRAVASELRSTVVACLAVAASCGVALGSACSLMVDTSRAQCRSDGDCARFLGSRCERRLAICVPVLVSAEDGGVVGTDGGGGASGGQGERCQSSEGCGSCPSGKKPGLANACTDGACVSFPASRLTLFGPDGGLRPLPPVTP